MMPPGSQTWLSTTEMQGLLGTTQLGQHPALQPSYSWYCLGKSLMPFSERPGHGMLAIADPWCPLFLLILARVQPDEISEFYSNGKELEQQEGGQHKH
jgi:hypothetical protein